MNPLQWLVPWEASFAIIAVTAVTAMIFIKGCLRCRLLFRQKLYFWIGLLSLYVVTQTQVDYYAEHGFFVHQLQSFVLHHLGPFLIVLACPKEALSAGCPMSGKRLIRRISSWKPANLRIDSLDSRSNPEYWNLSDRLLGITIPG